MMQYGTIPGVRKPVSRLIQGAVGLTMADLPASFALLDGVFAHGCTAFDTAHVYGGGDCDRTIGAWLAERGIREKVVIVGKGAHPSVDRKRVTPFDIAADIHDSLARLKTDYIDLYLLHRDDVDVPIGEIVDALDEHRRAGRIHAYGGSNWTVARIREANAYAEAHGMEPFVASSPNFSVAEQVNPPWDGCISLGGADARDERAWYREQQMPVLAWSSLCRGLFSGAYTPERLETGDPEEDGVVACFGNAANAERLRRVIEMASEKGVSVPQLATAYLLHHDIRVFPLVGCASGDEYAELTAAFDIALTADERSRLDLGRDA